VNPVTDHQFNNSKKAQFFMKINLLKQLQDAKEDISAFHSALPVKTTIKIRDEFKTVDNHLQSALGLLQRINDEVFDLTEISTESEEVRSGAAQYNALPSGLVTGDTLKALYATPKGSQALNALFQGGLDILSLGKFNPQQMTFAQKLGENFLSYKHAWAWWRHARSKNNKLHMLYSHKRGDKKIFPSFNEGENPRSGCTVDKRIFEFARVLKQNGAYENSRPQMLKASAKGLGYAPLDFKQIADDTLWEDFKGGWDGFKNDAFGYLGHVRVLLDKPGPNEILDFVNGFWFEAYVQHLFADTLIRTGKPHEIFTQLKYDVALTGKGRHPGELDVLVATDDKLVVVECKSGKFEQADADRVLQRKAEIQEAARQHLQGREMTFILVQSPRGNDPTGLLENLEAEGIVVLEPETVIGFTRQHFLPGGAG
jgi:Domain of unknown function (DUF1887)